MRDIARKYTRALPERIYTDGWKAFDMHATSIDV